MPIYNSQHPFGLQSLEDALTAVAKGIGQRFTPNNREARAAMNDPYHWWDPNLNEYKEGTPQWVINDYGIPIVNPQNPNEYYFKGFTPTPRWATQNAPQQGSNPWTNPVMDAIKRIQQLSGSMQQKERGGDVENENISMLQKLMNLEKDEIPIIAHEGEYVINKGAVDLLGEGTIDKLNEIGRNAPRAEEGLSLTRGKEEPEEEKRRALREAANLIAESLLGEDKAKEAKNIAEDMGAKQPTDPKETDMGDILTMFAIQNKNLIPGIDQEIQKKNQEFFDQNPDSQEMYNLFYNNLTKEQKKELKRQAGENAHIDFSTGSIYSPPPQDKPPVTPDKRESPPTEVTYEHQVIPPAVIDNTNEKTQGPTEYIIEGGGRPPARNDRQQWTPPGVDRTPRQQPQPQNYGFRAYNQPMPIDWSNMQNMSAQDAMNVLQQIANTQGAPFQPRFGPGNTLLPAQDVPYNQRLFNNLLDAYGKGASTQEVNLRNQFNERTMDTRVATTEEELKMRQLANHWEEVSQPVRLGLLNEELKKAEAYSPFWSDMAELELEMMDAQAQKALAEALYAAERDRSNMSFIQGDPMDVLKMIQAGQDIFQNTVDGFRDTADKMFDMANKLGSDNAWKEYYKSQLLVDFLDGRYTLSTPTEEITPGKGPQRAGLFNPEKTNFKETLTTEEINSVKAQAAGILARINKFRDLEGMLSGNTNTSTSEYLRLQEELQNKHGE
jgi:hypothetical protein